MKPDLAPTETDTLFSISLAQWSLHRAIQSGRMDHLDFAAVAKNQFGIGALEYVNLFFQDKADDHDYLSQMKQRAEDLGVKSLLIMCDGEGKIGDPDPGARAQAVENHYRWIEAARLIGCFAVRVNAHGEGAYHEQMNLCADSLTRLAEFAEPHGIDVLVENHGGLSSNGAWLASLLKQVGHPRVGSLPDFDNFSDWDGNVYDRYQGVEQLMPYAKAVAAKSLDFDEDGFERHTDYYRMMKIVLDAGYRGYVSIEYEGDRLGEPEGIAATKTLLERVREEFA